MLRAGGIRPAAFRRARFGRIRRCRTPGGSRSSGPSSTSARAAAAWTWARRDPLRRARRAPRRARDRIGGPGNVYTRVRETMDPGTRGALPHRDPRDLRANRRPGAVRGGERLDSARARRDHSVAIGTIGGLASLHGPGGVLWFDAHADFNTPETTPSGAVHGMPLAAVLGRAGVGFESNSWPLPPWTPNGWR